MAFIVKKKIQGKEYFYLVERFRDKETKKVKSKTLAYLGKDFNEAKAKMEDLMKIDNNKNQFEELNTMEQISIEELASFCKRKGFVYPSGDIYGGLSGFWDFGPLGVEIKNNLKREWWKFHVYQREDIVGIDGSIITNPKVWEASGHVGHFVDVAVYNKKTKEKFKVDKHEVSKYEGNKDFEIKGEFNPMFTTNVGPVKEDSTLAYLRPETAQLIFANFKLVQENSRLKLPFGIAQQGKAFRNEIAPRDFLFRSREFEQMEIEYFVNPQDECPYEIPELNVFVYSSENQTSNKEMVKMNLKEAYSKGIIKTKWHAYWLGTELSWFFNLGADSNNFRIRQHVSDEKSHYALDTWDLEYKFPFGWKELLGIANRTDFDLKQHENYSKKDLKYFDESTKSKFLPHVVCEPSLGLERAFLVFMFDAYNYDKERENIVLKLNPKLSPIKAAVFPMVKDEKYEAISNKILRSLREEWNVSYDKSGSIGRRYARADESGTPFCITIDENSLNDNKVTIRDRDTKQQISVDIDNLKEVLRKLINSEASFSSFQ